MLRKSVFIFLLSLFLFVAAQAQAAQNNSDTVMILPFENTSGKPEFNWVGESFAESLSSLLALGDVRSSGLEVISNEERKLIQQRLNIPLTSIPSIATSLKLAREGRASLLIYGTYNIIPAKGDVAAALSVKARIIRVNDGKFVIENLKDGRSLMREIDITQSLGELQTIEAKVLVDALRKLDRNLTIVENKVIELANKVPSRAFEAYVKGLLTPESDVQTREAYFKNAMRIYAEDEKTKDGVYSDAALELGHLFLNQRRNQEAVDYFSKIPDSNAAYAEAAFYTGLIFWQDKNYKQALEILRPLAEDLKLTSVYNSLGAIAVQAARAEGKNKGEADKLLMEGVQLLEKASESDPENEESKFNYGVALFLNNKYSESSKQLLDVISKNQTDGEAYFLLSKAFEKMGDTVKAKDADDKARRFLTVNNRYAQLETEWKNANLNGLNLRVEQPPRKDFVSVILVKNRQNAALPQTAVNETDALLEQSRAFYKAGRDDDAMQTLRRVLAGEPTSAQAYLLIGNIYLRRADKEQAVDSLRTALFWNNNLIDAHIQLGKIFLEKKDCQQAQSYAASALAIDENNQEAISLQRQVERCSK